MKINHKFIAVIAGLGLISAAIITLVYSTLSTVSHEWQRYEDEIQTRDRLLDSIRNNFGYGGGIHNYKDYVLRSSQKYADLFEANLRDVNEAIDQYQALENLSSQERQAISRLKQAINQYQTMMRQSKNMTAEGKSPKEIDIQTNVNDDPAFEALHSLQNQMNAMRDAATLNIETNIKNTLLYLILGVIVAMIFSISGMVWLSRSVLNPIMLLRTTMQQAEAKKDLTLRVNLITNDALGEVAGAFNSMQERFRNIVDDISNFSNRLSTTATTMAANSKTMNQKMQQGQSQTDQVAAAVNQMSATVQAVAENAEAAAQSTKQADGEANKGRQVVNETVQAIHVLAGEVERAAEVIQNLEKDSEKIGTVLDVIKGIAEQTNLLALNAAIEAARAGEQGRGFAVVADEVRTLASRTQESTQEINTMIDNLQSGAAEAVKVMENGRHSAQSGVDQAARAGESLESITSAVASIAEMNAQIAIAAEEQRQVADEINRSIVNINDVSGQAVESSRNSLSNTTELAELTKQLQAVVGQFRV